MSDRECWTSERYLALCVDVEAQGMGDLAGHRSFRALAPRLIQQGKATPIRVFQSGP